MSAIYDIAGTTSDSFMMNGKVTFLQGDNNPNSYQGANGDYYFQSNGSLWAKRNDTWLNLTGTALPDATAGHNKLLYSNGENYDFANIEVTDDGTLITEDPVLINPIIQKFDSNLEGGDLVFERADNDPTKTPASDQEPYIDFYNGTFRFNGKNSSGTYINPLTINIENNTVTATNLYANTPAASNSTSSTQVPTIAWVNDPTKSTNVVHRTGNETIAGVKTFTEQINSVNIVPDENDTRSIGTSSKTYNTVYATTFNGTALKAKWADLAEYYDADNDYPAGTLVCFGGDKEITIATEDVNAVVTSNPAVVMNGNQSFEHPCPIALVGRVPVRVIGKCNKFDSLVLSNNNGVATVKNSRYDLGTNKVIAKALEEKTLEETSLVLCAVTLSLS